MNSTAKVITAALVGAAAGAVAGVLMAPESGTATRRKIGRHAEDLKDQLDDLSQKVVESIDDLKEAAEEYLGQTKAEMETQKEKFKSSMENMTNGEANAKSKV